jgi:hypothetical protein
VLGKWIECFFLFLVLGFLGVVEEEEEKEEGDGFVLGAPGRKPFQIELDDSRFETLACTGTESHSLALACWAVLWDWS